MLPNKNKYSQYGPGIANQTPQQVISQINSFAQAEVV